ncbi:MAG TPA: thermonuclease family protein [Candidatus Eisenbacteria bacterium]|nr:thermonuclease family protein [Candidatus Eisenbacteria bacterium]
MNRRYLAFAYAALSLLLLGAGCEATPAPATTPKQIEVSKPVTNVPPEAATPGIKPAAQPARDLHKVVKVVDGDTVDIDIDGKTERIRIIGINTPETVDPRRPVECFGKEASARAKQLLDGKSVRLEADPSQGERDKYDRLLRFVFLEDGTDFGKTMIKDGYAYEYTYDSPYKYQSAYKAAQRDAESGKRGLWADSVCTVAKTTATPPPPAAPAPQPTPATTPSPSAPVPTPAPAPSACDIKGNISSSKEKIYHVPGCGSYNQTVIDTSAGERWFCSEQEAVAAGWRKAKNCP